MPKTHRDLVPEGLAASASPTLCFTEHTQISILDLIAAGEHAYVAAEICGVRRETLSRWLRHGRQDSPDEASPYYRFLLRYKDAQLRGLTRLKEHRRTRKDDYVNDRELTNMHTPLPLALFTEERTENILERLREGVFPGVAAEMSGVPAPILSRWVERGKQDEGGPFTDFYLAYMVAAAEARATAERRVYDEQPLAWLLHGPGRNKPESPGWSKQTEVIGSAASPITIITEWRAAPSRTVEGAVRDIAPPEDRP